MCSKLVRHHCAYVVGQKRKHIDFENSMQHIAAVRIIREHLYAAF